MGGKAYKVQIAFASTQSQVLQLKVHVPNACGSVSHIGGQVLPDAFQTLHFLLFFFSSDLETNVTFTSSTVVTVTPTILSFSPGPSHATLSADTWPAIQSPGH